MKFTIEKLDLLKNIQNLSAIVPSKNAMPILTNYLIEADEEHNFLKFTATDLEITVLVEFEANVESSGRVCVSAKSFTNIIHSLTGGIVKIAKQEEILKIDCGQSSFELLCAETNQYPLIPQKDLANAVTIDAEMFQKMVYSTGFAVSNEANRAIFTGIFWKLESNKQTMAATDGKKIAEFCINNDIELTDKIEQILPTKGLNFLNKVISDDCLDLKVLLEKNRVMFEYDNYTIFSHILEGRYPDYTVAIPKDHKNILKVNKEDLQNAIKRVSLLASEDTYRILFNLNGSSLEINTANRDLGNAQEFMTGIEYEGDPLKIAFNFRYLLQIIAVIDAEKVEIRFGKAKEPILVVDPEVHDKYAARFLLMPLRIS